MFQTHLPSGRRRLLFALLLCFSIVVFGMRYMLVTFGWVDEGTNSTVENNPMPSTQHQEDPSPPPTEIFSEEDRKQAQITAETFIKKYTTRELTQPSQWLQSFQSMLQPKFYRQLESEAAYSRPTRSVQQTQFNDIQRATCDALETTIQCHLDVVTEQIDHTGQSTATSKVYEVILSLQEEEWKIEGLGIHGSLD